MSSGFSDVATHYLECQCTLLFGWIVLFTLGWVVWKLIARGCCGRSTFCEAHLPQEILREFLPRLISVSCEIVVYGLAWFVAL
jgi:hypothetical protein